MNPIIRNLVHVLRRFKLAAFLNILGLSVAFAAFMVIMIHLNFHFGFDRFHKDYDKIFRLEFVREGTPHTTMSRPLIELFFQSSPHIVAGTTHSISERNFSFYVENNGVRNLFRENGLEVTPDFLNVFTFDIVEGYVNAQLAQQYVFIPLSMARRLFGDEPAVGRHLYIEGWAPQTVRAVYRDFPANSIINNIMYFGMPPHHLIDNWSEWSLVAYLRVNDASNAPLIIENFKRSPEVKAVLGIENVSAWEEEGVSFRLTALPDIHFTTDVMGDMTPKANRAILLILFAVGISILVIAAINFTNFSIALAPMRLRNINTQRVMGAQKSTIRWILIIEAVVLTVVSFFIALLLVHLFDGSTFANLIIADLSLAANISIVLLAALVAIVVGIVAGFYPSRYMTSFAPAMALKGNAALSPKGKKLRNALIGIQFMTSFALIIGVSFMHLQNRAMQNTELGFNRDALIITSVVGDHDVFVHQMTSFHGIENVTTAANLLSSSDDFFMGWGRGRGDGMMNFTVLPVHYSFLEVMGIDITEGRGFRWEDAGTPHGAFVFNEAARQQYNLELGEFIGAVRGDAEIIGFMSDVQFASFRRAVRPMAFFVWGTENWGWGSGVAYIQVAAGANKRAAMAHVRATLAELLPTYHQYIETRFFDEVLHQLYENERSVALLITLFSLIAIFISIVGVFGLVVFDSECRRKEIGIRKVMGATTLEIITMFNKTYIKILLICFVISVPLAWFGVNIWLENFAYRTPMYWWVFVLAFLAVAVITALTVTIQNWRVANEDPVKSIKTE